MIALGHVRVWGHVALLAQLSAGPAFVTLRAQPEPAVQQAIAMQRNDDRLSVLERRLLDLEQLHIAERLAILDEVRNRQQRVEILEYGVIITLAGNLLMGLVDARSRRRRREDLHPR